MAVKQHIAIRGLHLGGLILFVLILGTADLCAQNSPFDPALSGEAAGIVENVACFTDRSLYITEEPIRFSAMLKGTGLADQGPWSTVLYVELVSAEGKGMARGKYGVEAPAVSGNEIFERHFRVHMNTLEQLVVFLPSLWLFSHFVSAPIGAGIGLVFVAGRALYAVSYVADPRKRSTGFTLGYLANAALVLGALGGALASAF